MLEQYFDTVELTYEEVILRIKQLDREFYGETPQEFLKAVVYETKVTDTIIIMKINNLTKDDKKNLYYDDWREIKTNVYKWINSRTGNIFIIDGSIKTEETPKFRYKCEVISFEYPEIYEDILKDLNFLNIEDKTEENCKSIYDYFKENYRSFWKEM
jgi:hypothetical protein